MRALNIPALGLTNKKALRLLGQHGELFVLFKCQQFPQVVQQLLLVGQQIVYAILGQNPAEQIRREFSCFIVSKVLLPLGRGVVAFQLFQLGQHTAVLLYRIRKCGNSGRRVLHGLFHCLNTFDLLNKKQLLSQFDCCAYCNMPKGKKQ